MPEKIVDGYITGEVWVPRELFPLVKMYRKLASIRDVVGDPASVDRRENLIYDLLVEEVAANAG